ncbi:hypothetical protein [Mucilaginibacter lacusdianchii]|uniref:hypothetical protein n=1 Tax=Mucilaginibacter lacusdianchii TaxID=2684211 RepID=UPI00131DAF08|nr:hypothetical protein [Mucilaginibacter sp. JXJ CY 39]
MKSTFFITALSLYASIACSQHKPKLENKVDQSSPRFPVAFIAEINTPKSHISIRYRPLIQTIGEKYLVLPLENSKDVYWGFNYAEKLDVKLYNKDIARKILTLVSITPSSVTSLGMEARFKDSEGVEYLKQLSDNIAPGLIPLYEIEAAKLAYLNKIIWAKKRLFKVHSGKLVRKIGVYEPVKVVNVIASEESYTPVRLTLKTVKGETGTFDVDISGTNTNNAGSDLEIVQNRTFKEVFYTDNPRLQYHLSPAMWKIIEKGQIYLGIPSAAVRVLKGEPNTINTTTTYYGIHEQWVYGNNEYYYFENGKLTVVQN